MFVDGAGDPGEGEDAIAVVVVDDPGWGREVS